MRPSNFLIRGRLRSQSVRLRLRKLVNVSVVCAGLVLGAAAGAEATTTYYLGSSGSWGSLPANGSGASTGSTAQRTQNTVSCQSGCFGKAYYIKSDGSVYGSSALTGGGTVASQGSSNGVFVYSRCSHSDGGSGGNAKCFTIW